jgi:hypothetical protein
VAGILVVPIKKKKIKSKEDARFTKVYQQIFFLLQVFEGARGEKKKLAILLRFYRDKG